MGISLAKGQGISLEKTSPGLTQVRVGLGWDENVGGQDFDLDASAFLLQANGKVKTDAYFVFYNQLKTPEESVVHSGDDLTGGGDGDCEVLMVDLDQVPSDVERIVFTVSIYQGEERRQNFGQVANAYIRLLDDVTGWEVARYDLADQASQDTAMVFGELVRAGGAWDFRAVGEPQSGNLAGLCARYGVQVI
jgi:tellurium resistance protein TerD